MTEIWIKHNNVNVGYIIYDEVLEKFVYITQRKKQFNIGSKAGISISKKVLDQLKKNKVEEIRVVQLKDNGTTSVFISTFDNWIKNSEINYYGSMDMQLFLPIDKFNKRCVSL